MPVLITGVGGFVGRHMAALCRSSGARVIGAGRRPPSELGEVALDEYLTDLELLASGVPQKQAG